MAAGGNVNRHDRILALDVGTRRIGIAVTDPLGHSAQGLPTLLRISRRKDLEHIAGIIQQLEIKELVVGLPLRMGGEASAQTERVKKFVEAMKEVFALPIHLHDERLTSWEARAMLSSQKLDRHEMKGRVDKIAACLILQSFLEARKKA